MIYRLLCILILFSLLAVSCIEENPDLVNPPDKTASVRFRYLNLGYDKLSKEFAIDADKKTASIGWSQISVSDNPPADTGFVKILSGGSVEYQQENLVRFLRNTNYTYIGLSKHVCPQRSGCATDTLIALRTTAAVPENNYESLVKFMNAFPDTNSNFSIRLGCPSGNILFGHTNYLQYSINPITVRSGKFNFSVIQTITTNGIPEDIYLNLYSVDITAKGQYIILAHEDESGKPKISLIDENDLTVNALKPAEIVPMRTTEVRTINLSSENVNVGIRNGDIIEPGISGLTVGQYRTVETCKSSTQDSIEVNSSGNIKSVKATSLEVLSRYSLIVYDSADVKAGASLLVEPLKLNMDISGKSIIRVINTLGGTDGVNVSISARKENDKTKYPNGYSSGIILSKQLSFGKISNAVAVNPGPAPISVFTSSEPSRLLYAANTNIEADKSYLILISRDIQGDVKVSIINEDDQSKNIDFLKQGVFFQLVNSISDNSTVNVSIISNITGTPILENASLFITNSLATVIDEGSQTILINGSPYQADARFYERVIMVIGGKTGELNVITDKFSPLSAEEKNTFRLRFVNATSDIDMANLKKTLNDTAFALTVAKNTFSSYIKETREQKPTYFFLEDNTKNYLARFSDVTISLGKSYSVILYGTSNRDCIKKYDTLKFIEPTCYSLIIQQEF